VSTQTTSDGARAKTSLAALKEKHSALKRINSVDVKEIGLN